jgi:hypothetical protein
MRGYVLYPAQCHVKTRTNEDIYKSLARAVRTGNNARLAVRYRDLVSEPVLNFEFAPLLSRIISPPIRPVRYLSVSYLSSHVDEGQYLVHRSIAR